MVRALRIGIMLLTLLLVVVGGTGMVSVCPCHEEIFIFPVPAIRMPPLANATGTMRPAPALPALWPGTSANTGSWRLMI